MTTKAAVARLLKWAGLRKIEVEFMENQDWEDLNLLDHRAVGRTIDVYGKGSKARIIRVSQFPRRNRIGVHQCHEKSHGIPLTVEEKVRLAVRSDSRCCPRVRRVGKHRRPIESICGPAHAVTNGDVIGIRAQRSD